MNVHVTHNTAKNGIEIVFSNPLEKELITFLQKLGFKHFFKDEMKWYADYHPAYVRFAHDLKKAIENDKDWKSIIIFPTYKPSFENIDHLKFCIVDVNIRCNDEIIEDEYVIFENYKRVAMVIAERFAKHTFRDYLDSITIFPRNYKERARTLLRFEKVIDIDEYGNFIPIKFMDSLVELVEDIRKRRITDNSVEINNTIDTNQITEAGILEDQTDFDKLLILEVIDKLVSIEQTTKVTDTLLIQTLITEIEEASTIDLETLRQDKLKHIIRLYKEWLEDFPNCFKASVAIAMHPLLNFTKESLKNKSFATDLVFDKHQVNNILVPLYVHECFQKGSIPLQHITKLKIEFPKLFDVTIETLDTVTEFELFEVTQLKNYTDLNIKLNERELNRHWQINGFDLLKKIGYPTDLQYPYVSLSKGYILLQTLDHILHEKKQTHPWLYLIQNFRPIADLTKGINIIDRKTNKLSKKLDYLKTGQSLIDISYTEHVKKREHIQSQVSSLFASRKCIKTYIENMLNKQLDEMDFVDTDDVNYEPKIPKFHFDIFVAGMGLLYYKHKKPTLLQVESLGEQKQVPNDEILGEAIEISAIDFFRSRYLHDENYVWIDGMRHFWQNLQFDRRFVDGKQRFEHSHILPLPIAMMIARYLQMNEAITIFDPTAGSGNLLVGANERVTHANEVSKLKRKSLDFLRFKTITDYNPFEATPKEMHKSFDVVVCNPPYIKSTKTKNEKLDIAEEYLEKAYFLASHLREQAFIIALSLLNLKDNGKAVIVLNGHISFDEEGKIKYYRDFLNWLCKYYHIRDIINLDSSILIKDTTKNQKKMVVLINGRKEKPSYETPTKENQPHLADVTGSLYDLWERFKRNRIPTIDIIIKQLQIAVKRNEKN
ncbi:N-6 DNA methylase [Kordia sp.]|uniref:N-6 DNA methylase n=1 Tax=Kordia sp. TaxID=1965332 RepID=UPI003B5A62AE